MIDFLVILSGILQPNLLVLFKFKLYFRF